MADFEVTPTGRIYRLQGYLPVPVFSFMSMVVDYDAGHSVLPADVYEAVVGMVRQAWASSTAGQAAGSTDPLLGAKKVTVFDVAAVEYEAGAGGYYESSIPSTHPILGPWAGALNAYRSVSRGLALISGRESTLIADPAPAPVP